MVKHLHKPKDASQIDKEIGGRIKELRISSGVTRQDLAGRLQITQQQLQKYENGVNRITVGRLKTICDTLGVPIASFFGDDRSMVEKNTLKAGQRGTLLLMRYFNSISSPSVRSALLDLVRTIAAKHRR